MQPALGEFRHLPRWQWQCRAPQTLKDPMRWWSLWSFGARTSYGSGSGADGAATTGRGLESADWFEPFSCDGAGSQTLKWIKGQCVDASGNPAASATVQAFRTSDDAFAGEVAAHGEDGTFSVPTPYVGANHYLVAYKPGSPDIGGTTVNTLVPTNIDGT